MLICIIPFTFIETSQALLELPLFIHIILCSLLNCLQYVPNDLHNYHVGIYVHV